jgi:hypothetical protein
MGRLKWRGREETKVEKGTGEVKSKGKWEERGRGKKVDGEGGEDGRREDGRREVRRREGKEGDKWRW